MGKFIDECVAGRVSHKDIEEYVDMWHESHPGGIELWDFLGMTEQEYRAWIDTPGATNIMLRVIIDARIQGIPFQDVVVQLSKEVDINDIEDVRIVVKVEGKYYSLGAKQHTEDACRDMRISVIKKLLNHHVILYPSIEDIN